MGKYKLRLQPTSIPKSKILKDQQKLREKQLLNAVLYCQQNNCRGYTAVKSGLFPLIKDCRTINKRLDGGSIGDEKEYCRY